MKQTLTAAFAALLTLTACGIALAQSAPTPLPIQTPAPMATPPSVPSSLPVPGPLNTPMH